MWLFNKRENDCYKHDWGEIQSDGYNSAKNELVSVYNFDVASEEKINRSLILLVGKTIWIHMNTPKDTSQKVVIDLRGQPLTFLDRARKMKSRFLEVLQEQKYDIQINVEILI